MASCSVDREELYEARKHESYRAYLEAESASETKSMTSSKGSEDEVSTPPNERGDAMTDGNDTMYNWRVAAVHNALAKAGKATGPLLVSDLTILGHLDQYHYLGVHACDKAIETLGIAAGSTVLDVGSGIGGPARYISAASGCHVVGVEVQADLVDAAVALTARVASLDGRIRFACADFTSPELDMHAVGVPARGADHVISLLVFLHIPDRPTVLARCYDALAPGGSFLIEDFVARGPFTAHEDNVLNDLVKAPTVTSLAEYLADLEAAGFVDVRCEDMTPEWVAWTAERHRAFRASEKEAIATSGLAIYQSRCEFYGAIDALFANGNLGGARITGRRPGTHESALANGRALSTHPVLHAVPLVEGITATCITPADRAPQPAAATAATVAAATTTTAQTLSGPASQQPPFPESPLYHDSLQYHFFFGAMFVAIRLFHVPSLVASGGHHHSAWLWDAATNTSTELFCSYAPLAPVAVDGGVGLTAPHLDLVDVLAPASASAGSGGGDAPPCCSLVLRPTSPSGVAALHRAGLADAALAIRFDPGACFGWVPAGQEAAARPVLHRPCIRATTVWRGATLAGRGYSKRYWGEYGRHWGYRFIMGIAAPAGTPGSVPAAACVDTVWTADATFGEDKYNYWKNLRGPTGELVEAHTDDTWQRGDAGHAVIAGSRHCAQLGPVLAQHTIDITTPGDVGSRMDSHYENRLCHLTLTTEGGRVLTGVAYNERCYGTLR